MSVCALGLINKCTADTYKTTVQIWRIECQECHCEVKFPFCAVTREEPDAMVPLVQHDDVALQIAIQWRSYSYAKTFLPKLL